MSKKPYTLLSLLLHSDIVQFLWMSAVTRRLVISFVFKAYASLPEQKVIKVLLLSESILYKLYGVVYFSIIFFCLVSFSEGALSSISFRANLEINLSNKRPQ